jgi:nucleotide-binding universal stress UspA family protein
MIFEAAMRLAGLTSAKLVLYQAIFMPTVATHGAVASGEVQLEDLLIATARRELETIASAAEPDTVEAIVTAFARPGEGICRMASERDADLVVIGSHGFGGIAHLLGTVAGWVVDHADRNVLVVRTAV